MLAPSRISTDFHRWNQRWGAPHGREVPRAPLLEGAPSEIDALGPFAWQPNNTTRAFEYPWAYRMSTSHRGGGHILEVGGGLSGLQFVLAREGARVTNVDPGQSSLDWPIDEVRHQRLCEVFAAPVRLCPTTIGGAGIPSQSVDVLLCISALEHFSSEGIEEFAEEARRVLRRDGVAVLTVDLFLNLSPFTTADRNEFGINIDVARLLDRASLEMVSGERREILGFPEFNAGEIRRRLDHYLVGTYPALAQCVVARLAR